MKVIALGADHAGFALKEDLKVWLLAEGHHFVDMGTHSEESVDYPDYAVLVARAVSGGAAELGVLVCGTGIGMAIAANKVVGVRAAACVDVYTARMSREHNDANILALGGRILSPDAARDILATWLSTEFLGGRHAQRIDKVARLEQPGSAANDARAVREASHAPAR